MSQTTSGITFSNTSSGSNELYIATVSGSEWAAILLPEGSGYSDSTIDLPTAMQEQVYFVFAQTGPLPANAQTFINNYRPYMAAFRNQSFNANVTLAWLDCPGDISSKTNTPGGNNPPPNPDNTYVLNFVTSGQSFFTLQTFNISIGNGFGALQIVNNTIVTLSPSDAPDSLELVYSTQPQNFFFANIDLSHGTNSFITSNISIPFSGPGTGSLRFRLQMNLSLDFIGYGLQNRYYYTDQNGVVQTFSYNILQPGSNPNEFVITQAELDLFDTGNANGLNTYFAITDTIINTNNQQTRKTSFPGYMAIATGFPLTLWPNTSTLIDNKQTVNNIVPDTYSARFVASPQDAAGTQKFYMVPEGDFFIDPGNQPANPDGQYDFLPGLSGTEVISFTPYSAGATADTIRYISRKQAYAPTFPSQPVALANPGSPSATIDSTYLTAWGNIIAATAGSAQYGSQPQGASLFAKDHGVSIPGNNITGFLGHFEPSVEMPQDPTFCVPMVPYLGIPPIITPPGDMNAFESQILSAVRKKLISGANTPASVSKSRTQRALLANGTDDITASATPQGLVANVANADGSWSLLNLAQNVVLPDGVTSDTPEYLFPQGIVPSDPPKYQLSFINLKPELRNAFLTNQQFLVATNGQYLGELFSTMENVQGGTTTSDAVFNNKMSIEGWPFDINTGGATNSFADYNNVLIFKFCQGTLIDRVKNPKDWTQAESFNLVAGRPDNPDDDHNQLVAISSWLQAYLQAAEDSYYYALNNNKPGETNYYEKFHTIINSPTWNGILVLKANIDLQEFPQQLKGMICGINLNNFFAHHLGIEVNRIDATGTVGMEKVSSLFGLINYMDPVYASQLAAGLNPNMPVLPTAGATYDFKVLSLQILFQNTAISNFASKVQLTMNNLFSDTVISTNNPYGAQELNSIVLNGTYQDHNGTPVYVFANNDDNIFFFDNNVLKNVEITEVQFNTLTSDPKATLIESRFLIWGYLNFGQLTTGDYTLDAFSFGLTDTNTGVTSKGLYYSSLYVNMSFDLSVPTVVTYEFDASQIAFNSSLSTSRCAGLYPNFALQINNLVSGNDDSLPSSMGYLSLSLPGITTTSLSGNWYGLQMTLNMGTPGELAGSLGFNSTLLIAWSPANTSVTPAYAAVIGIKLPGTSSNAKLISLQGLLKLSIDKLKLQYLPDTTDPTQVGSYLLTLSKIALKFLGILKLPPGGNTNFLLFGNPNKGATSKSLGWYASYNKTQTKKTTSNT